MNKFFMKGIIDRKTKVFFVYETLFFLLGSFLSIYPIKYMEKVINVAVYGGNNVIAKILSLGGVYLLLQIIRAMVIALAEYLAKLKQAEITMELQLQTFSHISKMKLSHINFNDTSSISVTLIEDTQYAGENLITSYKELVTAAFNFIFGVYYISKINPALCLLVFPLGLISSIAIKRISEKSFDNMKKQRAKSTELWKTFEEGILAFLPLRIHQDIGSYSDKIKTKGMSLKQVLQKQAYLESATYFGTSALFMVTIGAIMILASLFVVQNKITIGGLTAIMMYNNLLSEPLIKMQDIIKKIQKLKVSLSRLADIYHMSTEDENMKIGPIDGILLQDVSYEINGKTVLKNIDLHINKDTSIMIKGETGAGKTTLVNIITGVYPCSSGSIVYLFQNKEMNYTPKVSYMLQDEYLFDDTILNNILVGNRNIGKEELETVIDICNLPEVISAHPEKIGMNGKNLSGGERKRVLLARTILDNVSDIFVFDEMSASLDEKNYMDLWVKIDAYLANKIRIYIEHNAIMEQKMDCTININNKTLSNHERSIGAQ